MQPRKIISGKIKRSADGFGFLIPDNPEHPDVYIPRHCMEGIMTSDKVMVQVEEEKGGERFRGEIIKITERGFKKVVGQFFRNGTDKFGIIKDEGKGWGGDLKIRIEDSMNATNGQLVAATILTYPDDAKGFNGRISEILGNAQDPMNDIKRVLLANNIPHEFSPACLREAEKFSELVSEADMKGRRDIRSIKFITIDGATAKDFDDAVYVETNGTGFLLYVAIADVSHYVQVGSAIDKDAYERGTSVYYPNFVTPMLPEVLSNGLCSLNPHLPRLALVAEMQMDFNGVVQKSNFYEAIIESKARVTYGEAQEIIEGNVIDKLKHVEPEIRRCADLAKVLMAKRFREGSLDLEIPETQMIIDASGVPIDIIRSERLFAHRVIEEMMLAANVAVAVFLSGRNIPAFYRIHEDPNADAIAILERYLQTFGGKFKLKGGKLQKQLTKALQEFEGKPQAQILNILTLRSMAQAKYSNKNVGHFGLGFAHYSHFTSPIRRYPDLIVHRLIKNQIMPNSKYRLMSDDDLATAGVMLSACEQRAVKSERQLISIKKARFMEKHVGKELDGMVSSIVKFGVFVLLREFEVDGLIHMEKLGHGYEYDEEKIRLYNRRSGHSYNIGDPIKVRVESVDIDAGQINFELAAAPIHKPTNEPGKSVKFRGEDRGRKGGSRQMQFRSPNDRRQSHQGQRPVVGKDEPKRREPSEQRHPAESKTENKLAKKGLSLLEHLKRRRQENKSSRPPQKPTDRFQARKKPEEDSEVDTSPGGIKTQMKNKKPNKLGFKSKTRGQKNPRRR